VDIQPAIAMAAVGPKQTCGAAAQDRFHREGSTELFDEPSGAAMPGSFSRPARWD